MSSDVVIFAAAVSSEKRLAGQWDGRGFDDFGRQSGKDLAWKCWQNQCVARICPVRDDDIGPVFGRHVRFFPTTCRTTFVPGFDDIGRHGPPPAAPAHRDRVRKAGSTRSAPRPRGWTRRIVRPRAAHRPRPAPPQSILLMSPANSVQAVLAPWNSLWKPSRIEGSPLPVSSRKVVPATQESA